MEKKKKNNDTTSIRTHKKTHYKTLNQTYIKQKQQHIHACYKRKTYY